MTMQSPSVPSDSEEYLDQAQLDKLSESYRENIKIFVELGPNAWAMKYIGHRILQDLRNGEMDNTNGIKIVELGAGGLNGPETILKSLLKEKKTSADYYAVELVPELLSQGQMNLDEDISKNVHAVSGDYFQSEVAQKIREMGGSGADYLLMIGSTDLWDADNAERYMNRVLNLYAKEGTKVYVLHYPSGNGSESQSKNMRAEAVGALFSNLSKLRKNISAYGTFLKESLGLIFHPDSSLMLSNDFKNTVKELSTLSEDSFENLLSRQKNSEVILRFKAVGFHILFASFEASGPEEH